MRAMIDLGATVDAAAVAASVSRQEVGFTDPGVIAIIELCRMAARFLIMLTVMLAAGHWAYGGFLLYSSGGDPRRVSQGQDVIKNTLIGVVLAVSGYMVITTILNFYTGIAGFDRIILFRTTTSDSFGIEELLSEDELALEGEVIYFDGTDPIICSRDLGKEANKAAADAGWRYYPTLPGAQSLAGCQLLNQPGGGGGGDSPGDPKHQDPVGGN